MIEIVNRETGELLDADSVPGLAEIAALHHAQLAQAHRGCRGSRGRRWHGSAGRERPTPADRLGPARPERSCERTWTALADWVGWLRGRYPLANQVPLCWWRHPELVEELSALWLAWRDAYVERGAPLTAGADWHGAVPARAPAPHPCRRLEHRLRGRAPRQRREPLRRAERRRARRVRRTHQRAKDTSKPSITGGEVMDVEEMKAACRKVLRPVWEDFRTRPSSCAVSSGAWTARPGCGSSPRR